MQADYREASLSDSGGVGSWKGNTGEAVSDEGESYRRIKLKEMERFMSEQADKSRSQDL